MPETTKEPSREPSQPDDKAGPSDSEQHPDAAGDSAGSVEEQMSAEDILRFARKRGMTVLI